TGQRQGTETAGGTGQQLTTRDRKHGGPQNVSRSFSDASQKRPSPTLLRSVAKRFTPRNGSRRTRTTPGTERSTSPSPTVSGRPGSGPPPHVRRRSALGPESSGT